MGLRVNCPSKQVARGHVIYRDAMEALLEDVADALGELDPDEALEAACVRREKAERNRKRKA